MNLYEQLLKKSKEIVEESLVPFKARKAKKELEKEIIDVEEQIANLDLQVEQQKSNYPLNVHTLIEKIDERDLLTRKLSQIKSIEKELFSVLKK